MAEEWIDAYLDGIDALAGLLDRPALDDEAMALLWELDRQQPPDMDDDITFDFDGDRNNGR